MMVVIRCLESSPRADGSANGALMAAAAAEEGWQRSGKRPCGGTGAAAKE
jgi:hypothetical protein